MLRLGTAEPVVPAVAGRLVLSATGPAYLPADLARRTAELLGLRVTVLQDPADREALSLLNIRPPAVSDAPPDVSLVGGNADVVRVAEVVARGLDPLALRLALLASSYHVPADLGDAALARAHEQLVDWRALVAAGAEQPSQPIDLVVKGEVLAAFSDDLDTARALKVLTAFARSRPADGAVFETFAWADRLLGLDLARDVGKR